MLKKKTNMQPYIQGYHVALDISNKYLVPLFCAIIKMPYKENLEKGDYMNIFISYSHIDKEFVLKLSSALEADGYDVFIDNKIPIGNNIYKDIGKGIAKADAVIVVISKNFLWSY